MAEILVSRVLLSPGIASISVSFHLSATGANCSDKMNIEAVFALLFNPLNASGNNMYQLL
jgi:hypothetical protein